MDNDTHNYRQSHRLQRLADSISRIQEAQFQSALDPDAYASLQESIKELQEYQDHLETEHEELRQRNDQLAAERACYFDFYNLVPAGCLTVNAKGMILESNSTAAGILGVNQDTLVQLSIPRFIAEEDLEIYNQHHRQVFDSGAPQLYSIRMMKADRTVFSVQLKAIVSQNADGTPVSYIVFSEITGRKHLEEDRELIAQLITRIHGAGDLRECMSNLTATLQNWSECEAVGIRLHDGDDYPYFETIGFPFTFVEAERSLCVYDPDGERIRDNKGNPVLACMCGNVLSGRVDPSLPFFTAQGSFWTNSTTTLLANSTESDRQGCTRNRCNSEGYESVALIPMRVDNQTLGLLQFNDHRPDRFSPDLIAHFERIAEPLALALSRRQAEEQLRESEEKYRTVANFTYAMETWLNPDGTHKYVSPSSERVTGYRAKDFLDNPQLMTQITYPDDKSQVKEHFLVTHQKDGEQNKGLDFRIFSRGGQIRWISHSCVAVYNEHGQWLGRRGSYREITNRKLVEEANKKIGAQTLRLQKVKSMERMAGAIAHHFNNKLHVVMGYLQLAMEGLPRYDTSCFHMAAAIEAADQAAEVSRLMLTYLGQATGKRAPLDLALICKESIPLLQSNLVETFVLVAALNSPGPVIDTDVDHIRQLLTKLVTNACEAISESKGVIRLGVNVVSSAQISPVHRFPVNWQPTDKYYACLEVCDNGCGLTAEEIEDAFDPFYSTKFTGRGLGLPVVMGLVQAHKGVITVESRPGLGSTFRLFFPLSAENVIYKPENERIALEIRGEGTVLVVDDDMMILDITRTMISNFGYTVLTARDGIEALEVFQQHKDDILFVLCDFEMPRLNGMETFHALRKIVPDIPVILTSGYSEEQVMSGTHPERPQYFLEKPYSSQSLNDAILLTLARRSMATMT